MMKKLTRAVALLLLLSLALCLMVSCRDEEEEPVPEGMMIANVKDDDFRLYVPTTWNLNTAYGKAGAYYNLDTQSTVSVTKYPITDQMRTALPEGGDAQANIARLDAYHAAYCMPAIEGTATGGVETYQDDLQSVLLDTVTARYYHMRAKVNGKNLHFVQVVGEKNEAFYVFTFICHEDLYTNLLPAVETMLENFIFADPYLPDDYARAPGEDENTPEGMILVSNSDVAYCFYVPDTWTVSFEQEIFAAYLESDRTNVSVVPYMPSAPSMSVGDYFSMCADKMKEVGGEDSFSLICEEQVELGGRTATAYTYTYRVGGTTYQYRQIVAAYKSMLYSMTYTALPENFEAHLGDLDAMIKAFSFR